MKRQELVQQMREVWQILNDRKSWSSDRPWDLIHAFSMLQKLADKASAGSSLKAFYRPYVPDMDSALCQDFCLSLCTPALMRNMAITALELMDWQNDFQWKSYKLRMEVFRHELELGLLSPSYHVKDGEFGEPRAYYSEYLTYEDAALEAGEIEQEVYNIFIAARESAGKSYDRKIKRLAKALAERERYWLANDWQKKYTEEAANESWRRRSPYSISINDRRLKKIIAHCEYLLNAPQAAPEYAARPVCFGPQSIIRELYNLASFILNMLKKEQEVLASFSFVQENWPNATFKMKLAWHLGSTHNFYRQSRACDRLLEVLKQPMLKLSFLETCKRVFSPKRTRDVFWREVSKVTG